MTRILCALGAAMLLASCSGNKDTGTTTATPPAPAAGSTASANDLTSDFINAWNSKDAAKVTSMLADDAQFVQGDSHFSGKSEVTNKWITVTINTINNLKTSSVSSGSDAALAYTGGTFEVDVPPTATEKEAGTGEGNFTFVWKKASDGTWKLSYAQLEDLPVQVKK